MRIRRGGAPRRRGAGEDGGAGARVRGVRRAVAGRGRAARARGLPRLRPDDARVRPLREAGRALLARPLGRVRAGLPPGGGRGARHAGRQQHRRLHVRQHRGRGAGAGGGPRAGELGWAHRGGLRPGGVPRATPPAARAPAGRGGAEPRPLPLPPDLGAQDAEVAVPEPTGPGGRVHAAGDCAGLGRPGGAEGLPVRLLPEAAAAAQLRRRQVRRPHAGAAGRGRPAQRRGGPGPGPRAALHAGPRHPAPGGPREYLHPAAPGGGAED